jgi:TPR repeat protein
MYRSQQSKGPLGGAWNATSRHWRLFLLVFVICIALWARAAAAAQMQETASLDDPRVQRDLGFVYDNGIGVPQDDTKAFEWYNRAADQGVSFAQLNIAVMYENGRGVPKDYVQAYKWYALAGDTKSRNKLAAKMSLLQIVEAKLLVQEWKANRARGPAKQ